MHSDVTSEDVSLIELLLKLDTGIALIKKLSLFLFIYTVGYFGFSTLLALAIFAILVFDQQRSLRKRNKVQVARAIALGLGQEKNIILDALQELPAWVKFTEIEKVEWLNTVFKLMWPQINGYAQDWVPKILEPAVQGYVSDFKFSHVVIGHVPLRVDGVKVYDAEDARKIVMDLDISYAGDCYVTFQTYRFTGGIKDIQLHGRLRVVLTPIMSKIPLIGGLQVYFMNPPHVDFDLIKFTQLLDIPGIRSRIKNTAMKIINSMFLYPNAFSLNLSKGVNVSKLAVFRTEGILRVHVVEAKNLVNKDIIGKSDPYVVLRVGGSIKVETPVVQNSLNPKWDFWDEFDIEPNSELKIEVWDRDEGSKDDFLGHATVDVAQVAKMGHSDMPIPLQGVDTGTIYLRLTWLSLSPNYADLDIAIKEIQMLSPYLHTALFMIYLDSSLNLPVLFKEDPSPFVELEIENEIKQTDSEHGNREPVWDKGFTFLLRDPKKAVLQLRINDENTRKIIGEVFFKVDNLRNEPMMALRRHTFFLSKPHSESSICCSMMLRILKNDYVEEKDDDGEDEPPRKVLVKQGSTMSNKSNISQRSRVTSVSNGMSDDDVNSFIEAEETVSNLGQIKVSLSYSHQKQHLDIQVHEIHITKKYMYSIDPYVRLTLQTDKLKNNKQRTKTFKNTSNPVFNESFHYLISSQDLNYSTLTFEVKSDNGLFGRKRFLGKTSIVLTRCDTLTETFTEWFNLKQKNDTNMYHLGK